LTQIYAYGGVALLAVLLAIAGIWPWVSSSARAGILVAALVAYPIQLIAFFLLVRFWGEGRRFLFVWVGGTVVRMGVILLAALAVSQTETLPPAPTLLALAGFFFGLLLLETLFLRPGRSESTERL
jgi:CDP-diglyceride synthetase